MEDFPAALFSKDAYEEQIEGIKLIQTHISWVFLTGQYAYKIKKPVNFGFLDFSTLKKRKKFCEKEFEINSKFSPQLYLDVLPITENTGKIKIGGEGIPIEYCIKMKQIPQDNIMTNLLEGGKIRKEEIDKIVYILLDYYEKAERGKEVEKNATFEIAKFNWDENFDQTEEFKNITIQSDDFDFIKGKTENFMKTYKDFFEKRIQKRRVRWCHGDLHSGNIFIYNGKVFIFDAIEFNERFTCSDIANDIAFLAMDLDYRNFPELGDYFIKVFVEKSCDKELLELLDFYKCYRAYVRGKVVSFRLNDNNIPQNEKDKDKKEAKRYFDFARRYAEKL